jgi:hypothetical protein
MCAKHYFLNLHYNILFPGNKCHLHGGICNEGEDKETILSRICCDPDRFFSEQFGTDYESLLKEGLVDDREDFWHLQEMMKTLMIHRCDRSGERCKKPRGESGEECCRVRGHPQSSTYWYEEKEDLYDKQTLEILEKIGLAKRNPLKNVLNPNVQWDLDPCLQAGNWHYPAPTATEYDGKIIPTIPLLAIMMRACSNVQGCDRRFSVSYLAKYTVGKEPRKKTIIKATKNPEEVVAEPSLFASVNEKLHSVQKRLKEEQKKVKKEQQHNILEVAMTEMIWFMCNFRYTHSNCSFVHINTLPPEYRATYRQSFTINTPPSTHLNPGAVGRDIDPNRSRAGFDDWRRFTPQQVQHAREYVSSNLCYGSTESFNIRPPELRAFDSLQLFTETFVRIGTANEEPTNDPRTSQWTDALGRRYKIRDNGIQQAKHFLTSQRLQNHPSRQPLQHIIREIENGDPILKQRFLCVSANPIDNKLYSSPVSNVYNIELQSSLFSHFRSLEKI